MDDLLTIQQVADELKISRQAVYKKIDKEFKEYLHIVNGKKHLDKRAIGIFEEKNEQPKLIDLVEKNLQILTEQNKFLSEQLKQKDRQIEELTKAITQSLEEVQKLADQSQQLHAMAEQKIQLIEHNEEKKETRKNKKSLFSRLFG